MYRTKYSPSFFVEWPLGLGTDKEPWYGRSGGEGGRQEANVSDGRSSSSEESCMHPEPVALGYGSLLLYYSNVLLI